MTKPTKWSVHPAKTQISLGIRLVWSESSLSAWRKFRSLATNKAHSEVSDQNGRMPRLICVFAGRTYHLAGCVMRWLSSCLSSLNTIDLNCIISSFSIAFFTTHIQNKKLWGFLDTYTRIKIALFSGIFVYIHDLDMLYLPVMYHHIPGVTI